MGIEGPSIWLLLVVVPLVLALTTAFTKVSVVLGALRAALGAEAILPLSVMVPLSILVAGLVMTPVIEAEREAIASAGGLEVVIDGGPSVWWEVSAPLQSFVREHSDPQELAFFAELNDRPEDDPSVVLAAFVSTELTEALMMAVLILVPLVLLDLLVAQAMVLAGLTNQPPALVVLPLKLLLFLAVGGWDVVIAGLVEGYR